jgi:hypothetical protein
LPDNINARRHGDLCGRKASKPRKKDGWDGDAGDCIDSLSALCIKLSELSYKRNTILSLAGLASFCLIWRLREQIKNLVLIGVNINARRHGDLCGRKASKPRKKDGLAVDCLPTA